jgi:LL-diaminopimelate aminotransferase
MLFINSPNNPTAVTADLAFFESVVAFARRHNLLVCHDAAYSEIYYDGKPPVSFLQADGAKEVGVEFHSLSKTFNMTGWRIGFMVGHPDAVAGLAQVKSNLDSGVFEAIQQAGIAALEMDDGALSAIRNIYQERRDLLIPGLQKLGFKVAPPPASFYTWIPTPSGLSSADLTARLISETGIVTTPGSGFGAAGEGYIRMTLTVSTDRLQEALFRMEKANIRG